LENPRPEIHLASLLAPHQQQTARRMSASCPLCGTTIEPETGPQLLLAGTPEPVCWNCAKKHSPQIFEIWRHAREHRTKMEIKRQELLAEAAKKPVKHLVQFDCFFNTPADDVSHPDQDSDALFSMAVFDLRNMDVLRVTLHVGTKREDALRGLGKIVQWIRSDPQRLITKKPCGVPF